MQWTTDTTGQQYTLKLGDCQAVIQQAAEGTWNTLIDREGAVVEHGNYNVLEEAQTWCLARLNELVAEGLCGDQSPAG